MSAKRRTTSLIIAVLVAMCAASPLVAGQNMIGNQSQNEGMKVLPTPGEVTIDGKLDDWDWSGRIWVFADKSVRGRYSAQVGMMWDTDALYVAVHWKDPTPMFSTINPAFNPGDGWRSDALQMRIWTPDQTSWITTWHYAPDKQPVVLLGVWNDPTNHKAKGVENTLYTKPGETKLGGGVELAYRADEDGAGYVQELRVPWGLIHQGSPKASPGQPLRIGMEFLWGDPTGNTRAVHRYADNVQPGVTKRLFFWQARDSWGDAELVAEGNVKPREYVSDQARLDGSVPIRVELPPDTVTFSLAIDDAEGNRVRNLGGLDVSDYIVDQNEERIVAEVTWDATADAYREGDKITSDFVEPGTYTVRGVSHKGLGAEYDMSFYNPGTPPWRTTDGTGSWGADHSSPLNCAAAGDKIILSWAFAEGGDGILALGPDGKKIWGEKRGGRYLAADESYVFAVPDGWHIKEEVLIRMDAHKGTYAPFTLEGEERPFELPTKEIFNGSRHGDVVGLSAGDNALALAMSEGVVALVDKDSAQLRRIIDLPGVKAIAFGHGDLLYALIGEGGRSLVQVNTQSGRCQTIETPGLGRGVDLSVDHEGNIIVVDGGADSQLKAYAPQGELVAYTAGKQGGRPLRGKFDKQAMVKVSSVAVDDKGLLWVTENWDYPRRVSVWNRSGELVRDYVGNTNYAATGTYLHESDPTLAYVGPIELKLDRATRSAEVTQVLWVPDKSKGEVFWIEPGDHAIPERFTSSASGVEREYLYNPPYRDFTGHVLYCGYDDGWRPIAAVTTVSQVSGKVKAKVGVLEMPSGEWSGLDPFDTIFWTDRNADGIPQRSECEIVPAKKPGKEVGGKIGKPGVELHTGWGGSIDKQSLTLYTSGLHAFRPEGYTDEGAPIWTPQRMVKLPGKVKGDPYPVPQQNMVLSLNPWSGGDANSVKGYDLDSGRTVWTYPNYYSGVHGSHRATMPEPGLLIGPLQITGVAHANDEVGYVMHIRGNLGQDFLLTTDGIFVGTLFQDIRLPGEVLPDSEEALVGFPMETFGGGGEPFNGWFGTQSDGVTRLTSGLSRQSAMIMRVTGLDQIERIGAQSLSVTQGQIDASRIKRESDSQKVGDRRYTIARAAQSIKVDGKANEWSSVEALKLSKPGSQQAAEVKLAYDRDNLYVLYEVDDDTPWKNQGRDITRLFKTGDTVDLQISSIADPARDPGASETRVLVGPEGRKPVAIIMKPIDKKADASVSKAYTSPVGTVSFDRVERFNAAQVKVKKSGAAYKVEMAVPWKALGITPEPGKILAGDVGFTGSDTAGQTTVSRTYWANDQTNLVNDEPAEAWLYPHRWGKFELGPR